MRCWHPKPAELEQFEKTPGIRMHQFPTNPAVRVKWVQFVRRHRHDFKDPTSKYTSLCSAHFEESSYERKMSLVSGIGLQMRYFLKKTAVPTRDGVNPPTPDVLTDRMKRFAKSRPAAWRPTARGPRPAVHLTARGPAAHLTARDPRPTDFWSVVY